MQRLYLGPFSSGGQDLVCCVRRRVGQAPALAVEGGRTFSWRVFGPGHLIAGVVDSGNEQEPAFDGNTHGGNLNDKEITPEFPCDIWVECSRVEARDCVVHCQVTLFYGTCQGQNDGHLGCNTDLSFIWTVRKQYFESNRCFKCKKISFCVSTLKNTM